MDADDFEPFFLEGSEDGGVDGIDEADIPKEEPARLADEAEIVSSSSEASELRFRLVVEEDTTVEPSPSLSTSMRCPVSTGATPSSASSSTRS